MYEVISGILSTLYCYKYLHCTSPDQILSQLQLLHIYMFYIYTFVRRVRAVNARATRKRRTGRLRFNGQYNRLENGYFSSKL